MRDRARRKKLARPHAAHALVDGILGKYGVMKTVREHRVATSWLEIVGDRIAARAFPDGLREGVLYVRVVNSAWLHELAFLRDAIARQANDLVGPPPLVKEVRFHLGSPRLPELECDLVAILARKKPKAQSPPRRPPPSTETLARIERETARVADPDLRAAIQGLRIRLGM